MCIRDSTHTNQGDVGGDETITVTTYYDSVSTPTNWSGSGNAAGAVFGFGNDSIYAINNNTGQLYTIDYDGSSQFSVNQAQFSSNNLYANATTNNDGAACHEGSPTIDWDVSFSAAQSSSCSGTERVIDITLNNSSGGIDATYVVTYSGDGHSGTITANGGTTVSGGASNTLLSTADSFSNGSTVTLSWYAENTSYGTRTPSTGTTSVNVTINASSCSSVSAISLTDSQSLGSCSAGSATSTLSLQNSSGSTAYVTAEYKIDSGSWTVHNLSLIHI